METQIQKRNNTVNYLSKTSILVNGGKMIKQQQKNIKKEAILYGGVFHLEPEEIQAIQPEIHEINNIIALAKADNEIKKILLHMLTMEFFDELENQFYTLFREQGIIRGE